MRVLVTGASGFVGQKLGQALTARGDTVVAVSRDIASQKLPFPVESCRWDQLKNLADIDAIVHLAGESVAQRWTTAAKEKILHSRIDTARQLREAVPSWRGRKPQVFVSASAIGFYGDRGEEALGEDSSPGSDFLARTCVAWEKAASEFEPLTGRVVILRFGMVLGVGGGALEKMIPPFRMGLGGRLGNGLQWMSWIHLEDLAALLLHAIDSVKMKNIYNAVAPEPVRNRDFTEALAAAFGAKPFLPVPAFALKLALGKMSGMLLGSQRVEAKRLVDEKFSYRYPRIIEALQASLGK